MTRRRRGGRRATAPGAAIAAPSADVIAPAGPVAPERPARSAAKSVYLVSYDLHAAHHDHDYAVVESQLRSLGRSVRIVHAQFLVQSERSADEVAEHVAKVLGPDDHLFVAAVTDRMAWRRISMGEERALKWRSAAGRGTAVAAP